MNHFDISVIVVSNVDITKKHISCDIPDIYKTICRYIDITATYKIVKYISTIIECQTYNLLNAEDFKRSITLVSSAEDIIIDCKSDILSITYIPLIYKHKLRGGIVLHSKPYDLNNLVKFLPIYDILARLVKYKHVNNDAEFITGNVNNDRKKITSVPILSSHNNISTSKGVPKAKSLCDLEEDKNRHNKTSSISSEITIKVDNDQLKDKFLATMSHELRTPLNGCIGMITMLKDAGPLTTKQQEYIDIAIECSHQLMTMLNNILDFSKMSSNRLVLKRDSISIGKIVKDSIDIVTGRFKAKGLMFNVDIADNIPNVVGDGQRLLQIILNVINNAIKFTDKGLVTLKVSAQRVESERIVEPFVEDIIKKWKIIFKVEDTGVGIPIDDQIKIFDIFHQSYINNNSGKTYDSNMIKDVDVGAGLGLSIVKELVRLMGGIVNVKSEGIPGRGSIFEWYIICDEEIQISSLKDKHCKLFKNAKILIVDDRAENRLQLTDMLFKWECNPHALSSGEEALQYLNHYPDFDTAIIDICMPYFSGMELAQELRLSYPNIPLIALSSVELSKGTEIFDYYLNKPIDQSQLFPLMLACLVKKNDSSLIEFPANIRSNSMARSNSKRERRDKTKLKILIVEDDKNNAYILKEMLLSLGYTKENITTVGDGKKCIDIVALNNFDVLFVDIIMPVMDGLEAIKRIRQIKHPPYVIVVSAAVQNVDKQHIASTGGIDGWLPKPIIKEKLKSLLSTLIK